MNDLTFLWVIGLLLTAAAFIFGYIVGVAMEARRINRRSIHIGDLSDHRPEAVSYSYFDKDEGRIIHVRNDGQKV